MDWGKLRFFLGEVLANFTRNAAMQATAIGTVAVTIVLLGAFLYTRATLADLTNHFLNKIEISVYLKDNVDDTAARAISTQFASDPRIISAAYVPRKEGLQQMRQRLRGAVDTSLLTSNPLPNAFRVRVRTPEDVPAVARHIEKIPGVATVNYAQDAVTKLLKTTALLGKIGLGIVIALIITAAIIISNTIRLTVFARRREIAIMQLVGATNAYIRWPFIAEGILSGVAGALLAVGLLAIAKIELLPRLIDSLRFISFDVVHVDELMLAGELLCIGAAIGLVASWISVGRYLRT